MAQHPSYLPLYRALVEYAQDLLGVIDLNGQIRYLSPAAETMLHQRSRSLLQTNLRDLCRNDSSAVFSAWLARMQVSFEREFCELSIGSDTDPRIVQLTGVRVKEDEYQEVIVISMHDATLEIEAARASRANESRFRGAFDYSPIGKALLQSDGLVQECNRALAEMLGSWVSQLIGSNLFDHFGQETRSFLRAQAKLLEMREQPAIEQEIQIRAEGQPQQWILLNMAPLWDERQQLQHLILQMQDTTARHQAEQALRDTNADLQRSNEELKRFAFMASHDLREPLRGIGGSIQLLARRYKDVLDDSGKDLAQTAVSGVKRLQSLLDELVAYTEQMRGGELQRATVILSKVVAQIVDEFSGRLQELNGEIVQTDLPSILGEAEQLRQIFWHLLDNALKFAHPQRPPKIEISAKWGKGVWQFCVRDNGIGIDSAHHEQVFEVFRRLSVDTPGTGMGLATVRKIIERHGGRIWVESNPTQGVSFLFTLPPE